MSEPLERASVGLQISIRESGDVTILDLRGRSTIDGESELLDNRLRKLIANGVRRVLLTRWRKQRATPAKKCNQEHEYSNRNQARTENQSLNPNHDFLPS
jgi:hypothetical protein